VIDALRGIGNALHTVASVGLMIDPRDLGHTLGDRTDADAPPAKGQGGAPGFDPTIFLYDKVPGGVGLAARLFEVRDDLARRARQLIEGCACTEGCPACVGPVQAQVQAQTQALAGLPLTHDRRRVALELLTALGVSATH
jgi:DEAD/DEAH box helicase domain-containing protein